MAYSPLTPDQLALTERVDGLGPDDAETAEFRAIGREIRQALLAEATIGDDLVEDVMLGVCLNDAVRGEIDVADDVMTAVALNAAVRRSVDVTDDVMAAIALNDAVRGSVDVAHDVMSAIALNDAVRRPVDVADAVMAEVLEGVKTNVVPLVRRMPLWASIGGPALLLAAAAALILTIVPPPAPHEFKAQLVSPVFTLASLNRAEVEDVQAESSVSLMQFDDGCPTILFIEDKSP